MDFVQYAALKHSIPITWIHILRNHDMGELTPTGLDKIENLHKITSKVYWDLTDKRVSRTWLEKLYGKMSCITNRKLIGLIYYFQ